MVKGKRESFVWKYLLGAYIVYCSADYMILFMILFYYILILYCNLMYTYIYIYMYKHTSNMT